MAANLRPRRMTADEFIAWAMEQPEGERYELLAGEVVAMSPERTGHGRAKGNAYVALREAIRARGLPCEAFVDSVSVRVDDDTVYEPDVLVHCGERLGPDVVEVSDPVILVEVRRDGNTVATTILRAGTLTLDPPGLELDVASLFED
jgi:Uma2 family endonuclease